MDIKILVADDDQFLRELVCDILKKEGLKTVQASDGQHAIDVFFGTHDIDMVILDVMMPIYNGWEVLKEIRECSDVPVVMLTALGDEHSEIIGLKKGADDYISKPFSYEVFIARINVLLRKLKKERLSEIKIGNMFINPATHHILIDDITIDLNRKEYNLLLYFIKNQNMVLTREQILNSVWGYDFDGDIRTIDTHIKTLRFKLLNCGEYIKTVRGTGYMMEVGK